MTIAVCSAPEAPTLAVAGDRVGALRFESLPAFAGAIVARVTALSVGILWVLVVSAVTAFSRQILQRVRLILAAPNTFRVDSWPRAIWRFTADVLFQRRTIREQPAAGLAHAFVFWGFLAFAGYTTLEFLAGLGIADFTHARWFHDYRVILTPFATAVLAGVTYLLIRRAIVRPVALGAVVSRESIIISLFIAVLMTTFLATWWLNEESVLGQANWWLHSGVILTFMTLVPASKHLHLLASPFAVFLKSDELADVPNLDFEKEQVGPEKVADLGSKTVLDAFACVECGRCQVNCPAWGAGEALNPKAIILRTREALLRGDRAQPLVDVYSAEVLWQCTTCGACENQCPVGVEHLPLIIGARRGLVSNGDAPAYLGTLYNNLERRSNIWGLSYDQRQKFVDAAQLERFDPQKHDMLIWLGCAGNFEAEYQKSLKAMFDILRARGTRFGVLAQERCTGDAAKRTGNEYAFQELATANIKNLRSAAPKKIVASCPHCVKTIGSDYRKFGYEVEIIHSSVFVEELTRDVATLAAGDEKVTFHDPCYLGRYQGVSDEPRNLLKRFGAQVEEPERNSDNPYCCGAGGGLLFSDQEKEAGTRISDVRLAQLKETGAGTVVTACPFCAVMLKGAQASSAGDVQFVDLMSFVQKRLPPTAPSRTFEASSPGAVQ